MNLEELDKRAGELQTAAHAESSAWHEFAEAEAAYERGKAIAIANGYAAAAINGKNADTQKDQKAEICATDGDVVALAQAKREAMYKARIAQADTQYHKHRYESSVQIAGNRQGS